MEGLLAKKHRGIERETIFNAHSHSRRSQKRQLVMDFQSNKPSRASSAASLGVGLGVRETRFEVNSYFPCMVDDESLREYGADAPLGGYMYGLFAPGCGRPYAGYGEDMFGLKS